MTDVPIRVSIDAQKAKSGKSEIVNLLSQIRNETRKTSETLENMGNKTEKAAKKSSEGIDLLRKALIALGGIGIVRKILDYADAFATLENNIKLVTDSTSQLNGTLDRLFDIAIKNRGPIEQLSELYKKISIASNELGASQKETFKFVTLVSQALAIQGAGANTSAGALLQLTQSLGAGTVRAEEFNSIMEGAFPIAKAAAEGLDAAGGSVAKLRRLVLDGKVTSRAFFEALLSQSGELEKTFAKMSPTIAQAGIVWRNSVIRLMENSKGLFSAVAKLIIKLSENLDTLAKIAAIAGVALLTAFSPAILGAAIGKIIIGIRTLTVAIAANPIGALAVAITTVITSIALFQDEIMLTSDGLATLGDLISVFIEDAIKGFQTVSAFFSEVFGPISPFISNMFSEIEFSLAGILKFTVNVIDRFIGLWRGAFYAIVEMFKGLGDAINDFIPTFEYVDQGIFGAIKLGTRGDGNGFKNLGKSISEAFSEGFNKDTIADNLDNALTRAEEKAKDRLAKSNNDIFGLDSVGGNSGSIEDLLNTGTTKLNEFGNTFQSIMGNVERSLTEFVRKGKLDFSSLVNSILDDMAQLAVRQFVTKPLGNAISNAAGSFFNSQGSGGAAGANAGSSFFSSVGTMFGFDQGVDYVPRDMVARLHKGEKVVTAADNRNSRNEGNITINMNMPNVNDVRSFRNNQASMTASMAKSLQDSMRRNN